MFEIMLLKINYHKVVGSLLLLFPLLLTVQATPLLWSEQLLWLENFVIAGGVLLVMASVFLSGKMRWNLMDWLVALWWAYVMLQGYLQSSYPCSYEMVTYSCLFALYLLLRFADSYFSIDESFIENLILVATSYEIVLGLWQLFLGSSLHPLYRVTGSFYNPGPYAAYVAMGVSIVITRLANYNPLVKSDKYIRGVYLLLLFVGMLVLAISGSRAALLALLIVVIWQYRLLVRKYIWYVLLAIITVGGIFLYVKFGSAMGRVVIWYQSLSLIAQHGVFGSGIGSFCGEYGETLRLFFSEQSHVDAFAAYADVVDYAFCDILQVGVEQGLIGLLLALSIVALVLRSERGTSKGMFACMLVLFVFSLFSYPFQLLPFQVIGVILLAKVSGGVIMELGLSKKANVVLLALMSFFCWLGLDFTQKYVEARVSSQKCVLFSDAVFIKENYQLLDFCCQDKNFLFGFSKMLQSAGRYMDSNAMLLKGIKISNDPMFWVLMGNNFRSMKMLDDAIRCYDVADEMLPNRLYPLYKKMLLWQERGNVTQVKKCAGELLRRVPKRSSSAVKDMQAEACRILNVHQ